MRHTGVAQLPLHGGKAPAWLFQRMVKLGREIVRLVVEDYGPEENAPPNFRSLLVPIFRLRAGLRLALLRRDDDRLRHPARKLTANWLAAR